MKEVAFTLITNKLVSKKSFCSCIQKKIYDARKCIILHILLFLYSTITHFLLLAKLLG